MTQRVSKTQIQDSVKSFSIPSIRNIKTNFHKRVKLNTYYGTYNLYSLYFPLLVDEGFILWKNSCTKLQNSNDKTLDSR